MENGDSVSDEEVDEYENTFVDQDDVEDGEEYSERNGEMDHENVVLDDIPSNAKWFEFPKDKYRQKKKDSIFNLWRFSTMTDEEKPQGCFWSQCCYYIWHSPHLAWLFCLPWAIVYHLKLNFLFDQVVNKFGDDNHEKFNYILRRIQIYSVPVLNLCCFGFCICCCCSILVVLSLGISGMAVPSGMFNLYYLWIVGGIVIGVLGLVFLVVLFFILLALFSIGLTLYCCFLSITIDLD